MDHPVGAGKIPVIVRNGEDGFSLIAQHGEHFLIKAAPELGVEISGNLVEQTDLPVFQQGAGQGQTLALPGGEDPGGKRAVSRIRTFVSRRIRASSSLTVRAAMQAEIC